MFGQCLKSEQKNIFLFLRSENYSIFESWRSRMFTDSFIAKFNFLVQFEASVELWKPTLNALNQMASSMFLVIYIKYLSIALLQQSLFFVFFCFFLVFEAIYLLHFIFFFERAMSHLNSASWHNGLSLRTVLNLTHCIISWEPSIVPFLASLLSNLASIIVYCIPCKAVSVRTRATKGRKYPLPFLILIR